MITTDLRNNVKTKFEEKRIMIEDAELVGFEEGLSAARVSTVHGVETKGQIEIIFACTNNFQKCNMSWSGCQTMGVYVRLEYHTL